MDRARLELVLAAEAVEQSVHHFTACILSFCELEFETLSPMVVYLCVLQLREETMKALLGFCCWALSVSLPCLSTVSPSGRRAQQGTHKNVIRHLLEHDSRLFGTVYQPSRRCLTPPPWPHSA